MSIQCTRLLASGQKCKAPAMKGAVLCRHHHPHKPARQDRRLVLPPLQDQSSVLYAATEIVQAIADRRIKRSDAATLLFGLQLAGNLMRDIEKTVAAGVEPASWEHAEADSSCGLTPEDDAKEFDEMTMEDAKAMLATLQTTSVDKVLEQWQAQHPPRAPKPSHEHRHPSPRTVTQPTAVLTVYPR